MLFMILFACVKQGQRITQVYPVEGNQCKYVTIDKHRTSGLLFKQKTTLQIRESLYYCCPDKDNKPKCERAIWDDIPDPNSPTSRPMFYLDTKVKQNPFKFR
jgi:hypothetical protein